MRNALNEFIGCDPVAMLRWSYVRLCMKCVNAFIQAGKTYHDRGGEFYTFSTFSRTRGSVLLFVHA